MTSLEYVSYNIHNDFLSIGRLDARSLEFLAFFADHPLRTARVIRSLPSTHDRDGIFYTLTIAMLQELYMVLKEAADIEAAIDSKFKEFRGGTKQLWD